MGYRFGAEEPVGSAIARCASEELDRAVEELSEGIRKDPVRAVHNARKAIKKERSLLRLARGAIPSSVRKRENAALRDAARGLAGVRDADVMVATVEGLAERFVGQLPATTFDAIREQLAARRGVNGAPASVMEGQAVTELGAVRLRVPEWQVTAAGFKALDGGLVRTYRRGRKAFRRARARPSLEEMHEWRKRVKDLWYHSRLIAEVGGPTVHGQAKEAHHLSDLLGDDHDLGALRNELTRTAIPAPVDVDAVVKLIDHRRDELQTEALAIGRRLYGERPAAFRRRMRSSWKAGRAIARAPYKRDPAELAAATREPS